MCLFFPLSQGAALITPQHCPQNSPQHRHSRPSPRSTALLASSAAYSRWPWAWEPRALPAFSQPIQQPPGPAPDRSRPAPAQPGQPIVTAIRVIGNRRIPKETVLARLFSHINDPYDPLTVERDFNSLWNTGYFEDVRIEREDTPQGLILDIYVREKPTVREINYKGLNSVPQSDVLEAYKKTKVGLTRSRASTTPPRVARAVTVLRELLAGHGHQFSTIKTEVKTIPPASVAINFIVKEGPKVEVGKISFTGNAAPLPARASSLDEEPPPHRHPPLPDPGKHLSPHLRRHQA